MLPTVLFWELSDWQCYSGSNITDSVILGVILMSVILRVILLTVLF